MECGLFFFALKGDGVMQHRPDYEIIDDAMAAVLREKTERQRREIGFEMWDFAQTMMRANVAAENPDWTEAEIEHCVAQRMSNGAV